MTILETLIKLRDDLKLWVTNNLKEKANISYVDESVAQKSQVQMITSTDTEDLTENLSVLQIHKLTEEQYQQILESGNVDEAAIYLTPDEEIDLSGYATEEYVESSVAQKSQIQIITWEADD